MAGYLFLWAIQTGWIGSFPGRNKDFYQFWANVQLGGSIVSLLLGVLALLRLRSKK